MRRLLTGPVAYAVGLVRAIGRGWTAFFFTPADPTPLALIRVAVGLLLLWNFAVLGFDLRAFLGSDGWIDPEAVAQLHAERSPWAWSFWAWVPDAILVPAWLVCLAVLTLFTLGLWSRTMAVLTWIIVASTARRMPVALYGFDQIIGTWALYLAVSGASGQAVSLDRFLRRWRRSRKEFGRGGRRAVAPGAPEPTVSANLGLRLFQLHLCLIYGVSGLAKLQAPEWWSGSALEMVMLTPDFRRFDLSWLAAFPLLLNLATHASLALEIGYPVLIWIRPLRPLVIASVALLHFGIDLTLGLTDFALAMLAGNLAFVSGPWLRGLATGSRQPAGRVLYDGACPRCRASMALLTAADPDRLIEPIDLTAVDVGSVDPRLTKEACLQAMHLVRADGRIDVGSDAVLTLARWLPLFWPVGAFGLVPGVAWLGRRVYNRIAATRPRDVPCTDEVCAIPSHVRSKGPGASTPTETGRRSR